MLDWFDDPEQRRLTGSILTKGEARNALARAVFNQLGDSMSTRATPARSSTARAARA